MKTSPCPPALACFVLPFGLFLCAESACSAPPPVPAPFRPDRLLILPRSGGPRPALATLHQRTRVNVLRTFPALQGLEVLEVPPGTDVPALVEAYRRSGLVAHAEPDYLVRAVGLPNDPSFTNGTQWALHNTGQQSGLPDADIDAPEAWDLQSRAPTVVVALIDSGIWRTHEDLAANLWVNPAETPGNNLDDDGNSYVDDVYGVNVTTGTGAIGDSAGHGTHLAGILGAVTDNGKGVAGVAWQVQIMTCRFLDSAGQGAISDAVACIDYARLMGAHVINASWVTTEASTALELAVASAREAGIVFVAGAGNDGQDNDQVAYYPPNLALDNVIAVAATDVQDRLWNRSNFGAANVDLAAPGVNIHSTFFIADNNYAAMTGSSQAAAFVSGAAALVRAAYPTATPQEVIDRLLYSTDPVPALRGRCRTGGRLNLRGALDPAPVVIWPQTPVVSAGNRGGPFVPDAQAFVILNHGPTPLPWSASVTASWLQFEPGTGTVSAGQKQTVSVALSPAAAALPRGEYTERVEFVLQTGGARVEVPWTLRIYEPATVRLRSAGPAGSGLQLGLTGQPDATYVAESSTNLSSWSSLITNALPASGDTPSFWSDPATNRQLFFRARVWQPN